MIKRIGLLIIGLLLFGFIGFSYATNPYCAAPPFIQTNLPSNIMLVLDYSGSMGWFAYPGSTDDYDKTKTYYGYFVPDEMYKCSDWGIDDCDGYWYIDNNAAFDNSNDGTYKNDYYSEYYFTKEKEYSGNVLNWLIMSRIDILRWILTGGKVEGESGCVNVRDCRNEYSNNESSCKSNDLCEWVEYGECEDVCQGLLYRRCVNTSGCKWVSYYLIGGFCESETNCSNLNESQCNNYDSCRWYGFGYCDNRKTCSSLDEDECKNNELCEWKSSYVITKNDEKIKVKDVSSYNPSDGKVEGILQQIEKQIQKPRIGAIFFSTTVFDSIGLSDNYSGLINKINSDSTGNTTATHSAVEYALEMYKDNSMYIDNYFDGVNPYEFNIDGQLVTVPCAKNFVLLMSDGEWNTSDNQRWCFSTYCDPIRPIDAMWEGGKADLVDNATLPGNQMVETYTVSMFANPNDNGTNALKWMAVYGNYHDVDNNGVPYNLRSNSYITKLTEDKKYPDTSLTQPEVLEDVKDNREVTKNYNGTGPYGFFEGDNPEELKKAITEAFSEILKQASSGSAASVLATSEESGAIILQALFYPKKYFDSGTYADWIGSLQSLWFYLGPFVQNIREDTNQDDKLNLVDDYVIKYFFDNTTNKAMVHVWKDTNGDGIPDQELPDKSVFDVKFLWDAGKVLWETSPDNRTIFTYINNTKVDFSIDNEKLLKDYLDTDNDSYADDIIKYIRGEDLASSGFRSRTVTIDGKTHVWKLGDIIYSTPKIVSGNPLNSYQEKPPYGYNDSTYKEYIESDEYRNRGMVFVGANDGMLHAFRLGKIVMLGNGQDVAKLEEYPKSYALGSEAWAFIPKNALPYLKYYMSSDYGSCHLYYVDLTPYVFDASIDAPGEHDSDYADQLKTESSWRTVLIGGMRFGGACGDNSTDAIKPPNDTGKVPSGVGLSSYFAIDVTDPEHPVVLWEFSDNNLGFTITGPSIIHIPAKKLVDGKKVDDTSKNGYWYVVFASGPDNYNGTVHQPLYLYVLDLKTGRLEHKWQLSGIIDNHYAFAGRMFGSSIDLGTNYSDDGMYFGYTYKDSDGNWKGGVIRVATYDDPDVSNWKISKLIGDIGPVTSGVKVMEDHYNGNLWVFFGEGRYFTKEDDASAQRRIYGIKDPCYDSQNWKFYPNCTSSVSFSDLTNVTNTGNADTSSSDGWYINLDPESSSYGAERVITDPIVSAYGWVLYTTFEPTNDICKFGGQSNLWLVNYSNGGTPINPEGSLYVQSSTGAVPKIDLSKDFGKSYGRKINSPVPPIVSGSSPFVVLPPKPLVNHIIHWKEK